MKPLLRTFLAIDAVIVALAGLFFLMTPWMGVSPPLAPLASAPPLIGQLLGVFLLGFAWMLSAGMVRGTATATIGWVGGHTLWLAGVVVLVWQVAYHEPVLQDGMALFVPAFAVVIVVLGLVQARLASMVGRRDRQRLSGARGTTGATPHPAPATRPREAAPTPAAIRDPYIGTGAAASRDTTTHPLDGEPRTGRPTPSAQHDAPSSQGVPPSF